MGIPVIFPDACSFASVPNIPCSLRYSGRSDPCLTTLSCSITPSGLEHFGRAVAEGFDLALIVTDSSHNAVTVAHDLARLARQSGIRDQVLVVNQVREGSSLQKVRSRSAVVFPRIFYLPHDPCVTRYEPSL